MKQGTICWHICWQRKTVSKCGVPLGSIGSPILFLLYENDLKSALSFLDLIMFADNANRLYAYRNMHWLRYWLL